MTLSPPTSKAGRLQRDCLALLHEHKRDGALPTSGRFIWYELVARGLVDKTKARGHPDVNGRGIDQDVSDALTQLRERGLVPWDWIEDETRSVYQYGGAPSVRQGALTQLQAVRLDPWANQPAPLILTESRSLAGVLAGVADDYCCDIAATNGQVGGFLHTKIRPLLNGGRRVLYLGDWDLSGHDIEANTRRVLQTYADLAWERLALTDEHAETLADQVIVKVDKRHTRRGCCPPGHLSIETEALSQQAIVGVVRSRLDSLLPEPLANVLVREDHERAAVTDLLTLGRH